MYPWINLTISQLLEFQLAAHSKGDFSYIFTFIFSFRRLILSFIQLEGNILYQRNTIQANMFGNQTVKKRIYSVQLVSCSIEFVQLTKKNESLWNVLLNAASTSVCAVRGALIPNAIMNATWNSIDYLQFVSLTTLNSPNWVSRCFPAKEENFHFNFIFAQNIYKYISIIIRI